MAFPTILYEHAPQILIAAIIVWPIVWTLYNRFLHPLANIPGPFLASVTRFWYVVQVRKGEFDKLNRELHEQYGSVVRISPNEISVSDPSAVQTIYGIKSKFTKTVWYTIWGNPASKSKHADPFADRDEKHHASRRRLVNNMYAMSSILESEPYINDCTELFVTKLEGMADGKTSIDLGRYLQLYAFDVIGELYFGFKFGLIEAGKDLDGWVDMTERRMPFSVVLANLPPFWRPFYRKWRALRELFVNEMQAFDNLTRRVINDVRERERLLQSDEKATSSQHGRKDMLSKLFHLRDTKGEEVDFGFYDIVQQGFVGTFAGSDTTAIALRAFVHQVLTHPQVFKRLKKELDDALAEGRLTIPVKYSDAAKLPYFCACVKEAMRLHPSVGLTLPRYVAEGGCEIDGYFIPEGMAVGINPAVLHYQNSAFGPDASAFKPERWLEDGAGSMDRYLLTFGGGSRTCIGKNISLAEIHKLLPTLFLTFDIELTHERPFTSYDHWFHRQEGLDVRLRRRTILEYPAS